MKLLRGFQIRTQPYDLIPVILLRLAVALLLGAVIGCVREQKEHAAGMRTLALVSLGCALFTILYAYGFLFLLTIPHTAVDPTRIAVGKTINSPVN